MLKEPSVKLPVWVLPLLLSLLLGMMSMIYTAGQTTARLDSVKDRLEEIENRLQRVEGVLTKK